MLLRTAQRSLEAAKKQSAGYLYDELVTVVFSALGIEAFCNTVGERIFESDWLSEHERKSPTEKLELLAGKLDITYDVKVEPWIAAIWLFDLRNRIAHAKPEFVKPDEEYLTQKQYDTSQFKRSFPNSKLENKINLSNAQRAFTAAGDIKIIFCDAPAAYRKPCRETPAFRDSLTPAIFSAFPCPSGLCREATHD